MKLYRLYVGLDEVAKQHRYHDAIVRADSEAVTRFDGFTRTIGCGGWWDKTLRKNIIEEQITYEILTGDAQAVRLFRDYLLAAFQQQEVLVVELLIRSF